MGKVLLGVLLFLWGLMLTVHLPITPVQLGILAIVTGLAVLAGK